MLRRFISTAMVVFLLLPSLAACTTQQKTDPTSDSDIRLYQVLPIPKRSSKVVHGNSGEGEAIAFMNAGKAAHTIDQWMIQTNAGKVLLPKLTLQPGQIIYLADNVEYFKDYWNFAPNFEYGEDTDKAVPDLKVPEGSKAPVMSDVGDAVRLLDSTGQTVDILVYGQLASPPAPWTGPAVQFVNSFPITTQNQVFTRLKHDGVVSSGTKADSWSGGTMTNADRVYFAGQSDFPVKTVTGNMTLVAASAPDDAGPMLFDLIDHAKKSIRLVGYQYTGEELTNHLLDAVKRGVKVQIGLERNPGGGDIYETDKQIQEILVKGGVDVLYYYKWDGDLSTRYNPVHSKYGLFDDDTTVVSSGNWINSVYNSNPTCGNREWVMAVKGNKDVYSMVKEIWDADFGSGAKEVRHWDEKLDRQLKPDDYTSGPCFPYDPVKTQPLSVAGPATITRILSPDNTFDREHGFLGLLHNAKQELLISANYINLWWGSAADTQNLNNYPNPYIQEIIAAARRGVNVKVIMDYKGVKADNLRDNQYAVKYLNDVATREKLPLEARLINMEGSGIGRTYHNKSLIVDGSAVISSINGSENSFRYAREMALKVDGAPAFTQYYRDLFMHDWDASAAPNEPANTMAVPRISGTFIDWSPNNETDVVKYQVYYRSTPGDEWQLLGEVNRPGFEDRHASGIWGVVAVNKAGKRSNYAIVNR
ncbi:MAG: phospholipase D-like domain-containing protein [Mycobacterium leprae]